MNNDIKDKIDDIKHKIDYMVYTLRKVNPFNFEYCNYAIRNNSIVGVWIIQDYFIDKELTKRYTFEIAFTNYKNDIYYIDLYGIRSFIKDTYFSRNVWHWINDRASFYPDKNLGEHIKYSDLKFIYTLINNQVVVNIDREIDMSNCGVAIPVYE
jgi:hypothetical protein